MDEYQGNSNSEQKQNAGAASSSELGDLHVAKQSQRNALLLQQAPPIFAGDITCFQEIFEWLSLQDITLVGQTCKRLQAIAGDFFSCYLSAAELECTDRGIESLYFSRPTLNGFQSNVQKIEISSEDDEIPFQHIGSMMGGQLKRIAFTVIDMSSDRINYIKGVLDSIESVEFNGCKFIDEFYSCFLQFCPNLKHLIVRGCDISGDSIIGSCNQWLAREYPKLKHFKMFPYDNAMMSAPEVATFFERNQQIKSLKVHLLCLWYHKATLLNSKIQLDILIITIKHFGKAEEQDEAFALLHQLYDQGFYKRLHVNDYNSLLDDRVAAFPGLGGLTIMDNDIPSNSVASLTHIKELTLISTDCVKTFDEVLRKLSSLERLNLECMDTNGFDQLLPFLQHCAKLNEVKVVEYFLPYSNGNVLNLSEWNKEREKLTGAQKVTIFIKEKHFLATKWSNQTIDLKFIEIRRADSFEWDRFVQ